MSMCALAKNGVPGGGTAEHRHTIHRRYVPREKRCAMRCAEKVVPREEKHHLRRRVSET
jgi:hypothetical protein